MQTNPVWRMVRALIATYILSGILLMVLSFALFKFRLPENQVKGDPKRFAQEEESLRNGAKL